MKRTIEQEIDQTLNCLSDSDSIQVSDLFIDTVSSRISHLRTRRGIGYRSRALYPVVLLLMVVLNLTVLFSSSGQGGSSADRSSDSLSVVANEYGLGQSSYMSL